MQPTSPPGLVETVRDRADILAVIALGGALGSLARYGVGEALPHRPGEFPWSTFVENVAGSFLLGVLMIVVLEVRPATRYLRPFLGVGVLGGFTTFSTAMLDTHALAQEGVPLLLVAYLAGTVVSVLVAVAAAVALTRAAAGVGRGRRTHPGPPPHEPEIE